MGKREGNWLRTPWNGGEIEAPHRTMVCRKYSGRMTRGKEANGNAARKRREKVAKSRREIVYTMYLLLWYVVLWY